MAVYKLIGVVDNGTTYFERDVPANPRATLAYTRGVTARIEIAVVGRNGVPVDLSSGTPVVTFTVKKNSDNYEAVFQATATLLAPESAGLCVVAIPANALSIWEPGNYVYDIWLEQTVSAVLERNCIVPLSPFKLEPNAMNAPF